MPAQRVRTYSIFISFGLTTVLAPFARTPLGGASAVQANYFFEEWGTLEGPGERLRS